MLRKVFGRMKQTQIMLQEVIVPKGCRELAKASEALMEAQAVVWNMILSGFDNDGSPPRPTQLNFSF